MKKVTITTAFVALSVILCLSLTTAENSSYIFSPNGELLAVHAKDITFYNKTHKLAWFRISGADRIYTNGTMVFKRTSEITITTHKDLKGSVWICTYGGWNPLKGEIEYYKDRGYCYVTWIKGKAEISAAKLVPSKKYVLMIGLYDTSSMFSKEKNGVWIRTDDPSTFDRVEVFGYGPIQRAHFTIVVE